MDRRACYGWATALKGTRPSQGSGGRPRLQRFTVATPTHASYCNLGRTSNLESTLMAALLISILAFTGFISLLTASFAYLLGMSWSADAIHRKNGDDAVLQRRRSRRRHVRRRARVITSQGNNRVSCRIVNLSNTGAMLASSQLHLCPEEFVLKPYFGKHRTCQGVWRKEPNVGVRFIADPR